MLEAGLAHSANHPALCHLYIHTMEAGPEVAEAVPSAETLETLTPGLGHLIHMPSHIYTWTGRYDDVIRVNQRAVEVDRAFVEHAGRDNFYTLYRLHNYHFVAYGAMFAGRREVAMAAARELVTEIPPDPLVEFADFLDIFVGTPYHVMVRFGMWDEMLAEPKPAVESQFMTGIWHYGRALAFVHTARPAQAREELGKISPVLETMDMEAHYIGFGTAGVLLTIAEEIVKGELAYAGGRALEGLAHLERAVRLEDILRYNEPPDWYFPVRHFLGAMLLDDNRPNEAEVVYSADLRKNPENGYSLFGLKVALEQQDKTEDALAVAKRFELAWGDATHELVSSRF